MKRKRLKQTKSHVDPWGRRSVIDYNAPSREVIWQCLEVCAATILRKMRINLHEDYHDVQTDIMIDAYSKITKYASSWDTRYPLYTFVYYWTWSVTSKHITQWFAANKRWDFASLESMGIFENDESIYSSIPHEQCEMFWNDTLKNNIETKYVQNKCKCSEKVTKKREYEAYCDCCEELGREPISFDEYSQLNFSEAVS